MVENELAGKGRPTRIWHLYEREIILEHLARSREKLGLSLLKHAEIRQSFMDANLDKLQALVESIYKDSKQRRSLLNFVAGKHRPKDGEPKFAMLGVTNEVKARFMQAKPESMVASEFLEHLMDLYDAKKD